MTDQELTQSFPHNQVLFICIFSLSIAESQQKENFRFPFSVFYGLPGKILNLKEKDYVKLRVFEWCVFGYLKSMVLSKWLSIPRCFNNIVSSLMAYRYTPDNNSKTFKTMS